MSTPPPNRESFLRTDLRSFTPRTPDSTCPICLDPIDYTTGTQISTCSHFYHFNCLLTWLDHHATCPMCRARLFAPASELGTSDWTPLYEHLARASGEYGQGEYGFPAPHGNAYERIGGSWRPVEGREEVVFPQYATHGSVDYAQSVNDFSDLTDFYLSVAGEGSSTEGVQHVGGIPDGEVGALSQHTPRASRGYVQSEEDFMSVYQSIVGIGSPVERGEDVVSVSGEATTLNEYAAQESREQVQSSDDLAVSLREISARLENTRRRVREMGASLRWDLVDLERQREGRARERRRRNRERSGRSGRMERST